MIQDAINELESLLERYVEPFRFEIVAKDHFCLEYSMGKKDLFKIFDDVSEMLKWMEDNFTEKNREAEN